MLFVMAGFTTQVSVAAVLSLDGKIFSFPEEVKQALRSEGIEYQFIEVDPGLNTDKESVLKQFSKLIRDFKSKGYQSHDYIYLSDNKQGPQKMNEILGKFSKEHHHPGDGIRFITAGSGKFRIKKLTGGWFDLIVQVGDLIVMPSNRKHRFSMSPNAYGIRSLGAIRLFKKVGGWKAEY